MILFPSAAGGPGNGDTFNNADDPCGLASIPTAGGYRLGIGTQADRGLGVRFPLPAAPHPASLGIASHHPPSLLLV